MTSPQRFEQDLPALLADLYATRTPDYRDDLVQQIARVRQRPAWTFPERWLPINFATQPVAAPRFPWRAIGVLALIGLLLAAMLAAYVGSQPRLPAPFGLAENGQLAYVVDGDIYLRPSLDSPGEPLVSGPEVETAALFSPLGDRLAFLREVEGGEDLWVIDTDGQGLQRLGGPYRSLDWIEWSPDGRNLALSYDRRAINAIEIVPTDGSGGRRIAANMPAMSPSWRPPDGRQLLFRGQEDGRWGFFLVDPDGGEPVRLEIGGERIEGGGYDLQAPAWSPAGDRLAFHTLVRLPESQIQTPGFRLTVATIDPAGAVVDQRPLEFSSFADDEFNPVFTPDGSQLVYQQRLGWTPPDPSSGTPTVDTLWIAPVDGRGPARDLGIESRNGDGFSAVVAPDGTSLLVHLRTEGEVWLIDPVTAVATRTDLASSSGVTWQRRGK